MNKKKLEINEEQRKVAWTRGKVVTHEVLGCFYRVWLGFLQGQNMQGPECQTEAAAPAAQPEQLEGEVLGGENNALGLGGLHGVVRASHPAEMICVREQRWRPRKMMG